MTAEPRYTMTCPGCSIVWHNTRSENIPGERCKGLSRHDPEGCLAPLPAPVPEARKEGA
jgi:hypothetical protein